MKAAAEITYTSRWNQINQQFARQRLGTEISRDLNAIFKKTELCVFGKFFYSEFSFYVIFTLKSLLLILSELAPSKSHDFAAIVNFSILKNLATVYLTNPIAPTDHVITR